MNTWLHVFIYFYQRFFRHLLDTSTNSQIIENVHSILATAASKLNLELYEHLTSLIKKKWEVSEGRVREKLLRLIGQIGREAKQAKSIEATLQVLWEVVSNNTSKALMKSKVVFLVIVCSKLGCTYVFAQFLTLDIPSFLSFLKKEIK